MGRTAITGRVRSTLTIRATPTTCSSIRVSWTVTTSAIVTTDDLSALFASRIYPLLVGKDKLVESDIKNNFIPDTTQDEIDENEDFVFKIQEDTNPNPFAQLKQQLNIGNTTSIPRVPSYPLQLSNLNNAFCLSANSSNIMDELNNSFKNGNNQFYNAFGFLNNSFSMNGKSGWVCRACKNFNYESK